MPTELDGNNKERRIMMKAKRILLVALILPFVCTGCFFDRGGGGGHHRMSGDAPVSPVVVADADRR